MIDTTLLDAIKVLADKERKIKGYKRRIRLRGIVADKKLTRNGNISLIVEKDSEEYRFTVLKSHKERYALAHSFRAGKSVSIEGIPKFRMIICTRLKVVDKGIEKNRQAKLILA
ncbi:hypothetical protein J4212_08235 [Candidatus Woesearchaeota archaeon]|nr:hypothetical protein [Candidatus Woesearchaeota archaeon]